MLRAAAACLLGLAAAWLLGRGWQRAGGRLLSAAELARYTGAEGSPGLYLAVLGQVFDVRRGREHYGPGGAYSGLAGRDASRAFVTGDFSAQGLVDDVSGLPPRDAPALRRWLRFYQEQYGFVGKLVGRFYDENGAPTEALKQAEALIEEGLKLKAQSEEENQQFPPCNSEWSSSGGTRFWCSKQSGGVKRDWIGVPRKLYKPGSRDSYCVCARTTGPPSGQLDYSEHKDRGDLDNPHLQEYEGCHPLADWCALRD
ncbi:neuferricin [Alligator mississippiensis]|uniref:Neuferricin n=1 Tax=Alligator mississippiensis TaxID=8496 RepID=A0A151N5F7_ALLMI|nr:neuferricin [Alligator mississippiensis]